MNAIGNEIQDFQIKIGSSHNTSEYLT